jgi:formyltetrahydrofolate synthetase
MEGLGKRGKNVGGCLRQPSGGPTMNVKGTAAAGGNALLIPMTEFSLGLTGDINDIANAHNLAMVALIARMQHERNYGDEQLAKLNRESLRLSPNVPDAHFRLGQAYVHLGKKDLADKEFQVLQQLYEQHLAEVDKERSEIQQFVYSMKDAP